MSQDIFPIPPVTGTVTANAGTNLNTSALALDATLGTTNTEVGIVTETAPATDTASSGLNGRLQRIAQRLTSLIALLPAALGAGGGIKVDGSGTALPVSGTVTANAGTNLNTSALALDATQSTTNTEIGGLTETAPATDTASSGLNGRLQRIAQRLTSLIDLTQLPTRTVDINATLTRPSDTTAYADGDTVSSSTSAPTILTFSNCVQVSGGTGMIVAATMRDSAYSATPGIFELWLLDTTTTPDNDNAAFTPTDGEVDTCVAVIRFSLVYPGDKTAGATGNMLYVASGLNIPFVAAATNLFGIVVVRGAYTPISAETFKFRLKILQD